MKFTALLAVAFAVTHTEAHDIYRMRQKNSRDAYDHDPNSASPYDDMEQHHKWDFGVPKGSPGHKDPWAKYAGTWVDMGYEA